MSKTKMIRYEKAEEATPEDLAEAFAALGSDGQARFFNRLAEVASTWPSGGLPMQLQYVTDDDGLTLRGRMAMAYIGEYSHWGLRCESPLTAVGES